MANPQAPPSYSDATKEGGPGYPPPGGPGYPPQAGYPPQGQFQGYPPGQVYNDPAYAPGTAPPAVGYGRSSLSLV